MIRRPGEDAGPLRRASQAVSSTLSAVRLPAFARSVARPCWFGMKCALPLIALAVLAGIGFYIRLLYGPISLNALADPIARSIAAEMPELGVDVEGALVRLNEQGQIEFRLRNVRLTDAQGSPVVVAPLAALELSRDALWSARFSPRKVVLIEPQLLLTYSRERGLTFSFARLQASDAGLAAKSVTIGAGEETGDPNSSVAASGLPIALRQVDLARVIAEATAKAREREDASFYLRQIGIRDATVILDHEGQPTVWRVPQAEMALRHKRARSQIGGSLMIDSGQGPWELEFWTEASGDQQEVSLKASVRNLIPRTIADTLPALAPLSAFNLPTNGDVHLRLTSRGEVLGGSFSLDVGGGEVTLPWLGSLPLRIAGGNFDLKYDPGAHALRIEPSTLHWGQSRVTIQGRVASSVGVDGLEVWTYHIEGLGGQLAPEETDMAPVALESLSARGTFKPETGAFTITKTLFAGSGELYLEGEATGGSAPEVRVEGHMSTVPVATMLGIWPSALGSNARTWVRDSIKQGSVLGGSFRYLRGSAIGGGTEQGRLSVAIQAADVVMQPGAQLPTLHIPRGLIRLEGPMLEVTVPEAHLPLGGGRKLTLAAARFTAPDVMADPPIGELALQANASVSSVLALLAQKPFELGHLLNERTESLEGKVEAALTFKFPLKKHLALADVQVEGRGKLLEGRARNLIGKHDAQAATITFDISDRAIDAKGDLLVSSVPVKFEWQRIFDAPPGKQPPLRLKATLDRADRDQLRIDPDHHVHGEVPVEVTITQDQRGESRVHVWADLTSADIILDRVVWRKPAGRHAIMQFDLRRGERYETELRDFKVVGDDIAIGGWIGLDANDKIREFHFPDYSVNIVSRLDVRGILRNDNVWHIRANGQTYDGREVFRALFSFGENEDEKPRRKDAPGTDFEATISNVIGFSDVSLRNLSLKLSRRDGKLTAFKAEGVLDGGKPLTAELYTGRNQPRQIVVLTDDAGQAFRLVDFYPNVVGGRMRLDINLDGRGAAEKTGLLRVERFRILGDPVVSEVLQVPDDTRPYVAQRQRRVIRQAFDFDWMRLPFSIGHGQLVINDSEIRGPLVGATLRGKADFRTRQVNIGGTYVPLQGLNSALGFIPGLGQLLTGPQGEGVLGMTFAIRGPMENPEVLVNPLSLVAPGIFREMFQMTPNQRVTPPRSETEQAPSRPKSRSSAAPTQKPAAKRNNSGTSGVVSGWSSGTSVSKQ